MALPASSDGKGRREDIANEGIKQKTKYGSRENKRQQREKAKKSTVSDFTQIRVEVEDRELERDRDGWPTAKD